MKIRKLFAGIVIVVFLLGGWIAINSIDEPPRYDQSLLLQPVSIPDEQNGFAVLRYLDSDGDKRFVLGSEDSRRLHKIIVDWEWDAQFAEKMLAERAAAIDLVRQVVARPRFAVDRFGENVYSDYPSYQPVSDLQKIVLLKARMDEKKGNYADAIETAGLAMHYCEKIRLDEQKYMVSYLVGWVCVDSVADFYHELVSNNSLSASQLIAIERVMSGVSEYEKDDFVSVIKREWSEEKYISQWYERYNFIERIHIVHDAIREGRFCVRCSDSALDKAYGYFSAIFARYYWHANESMNVRSLHL